MTRNEIIDAIKDRLRQPVSWDLYPALISFALVMVFIGHLLPGLNPRLGNRANVITYPANTQPDGAIWLSIFPQNGHITIRTGDKVTFHFDQEVETDGTIAGFSEYLHQRAMREIAFAGASMSSNTIRTSVVLAVDQRLKFIHIRPILYALAQAGISRYSFETRLIKDDLSLSAQ